MHEIRGVNQLRHHSPFRDPVEDVILPAIANAQVLPRVKRPTFAHRLRFVYTTHSAPYLFVITLLFVRTRVRSRDQHRGWAGGNDSGTQPTFFTLAIIVTSVALRDPANWQRAAARPVLAKFVFLAKIIVTRTLTDAA